MTLETLDVAQLRENWRKQGNPPCDHPTTAAVYSDGFATGDNACIICGEDGHAPDWDGKVQPADDDGNSW